MGTTEVNIVHGVFIVIETISHDHFFFTVRIHVVHVDVRVLSPEGRGRINHHVKAFAGNTKIVFPILVCGMIMSLLNFVDDVVVGGIINAEVFVFRRGFVCSHNFVEGSIAIDKRECECSRDGGGSDDSCDGVCL